MVIWFCVGKSFVTSLSNWILGELNSWLEFRYDVEASTKRSVMKENSLCHECIVSRRLLHFPKKEDITPDKASPKHSQCFVLLQIFVIMHSYLLLLEVYLISNFECPFPMSSSHGRRPPSKSDKLSTADWIRSMKYRECLSKISSAGNKSFELPPYRA